MPTKDKENKGFDASSITGIPTPPKTKKLEPGTGPLKPGTTKADAKKLMDKNAANRKADAKAKGDPKAKGNPADYFENTVMPKVKASIKAKADPKAKGDPKTKETPKGGTYASAKKKDPKLDSYIKARNNAKKGSSAYNAAQNKINVAYEKGPTDRKVTKVAKGSEVSTGVMRPKAEAETKTKAEKVTSTGIPKDAKAPKPKTAMEKAKEAIASGDKKAAKESGLKGKRKRVAKRSAGKASRAIKKEAKAKDLAELRGEASPTTFKSFDQMDSQNAMATAGEAPMEMKSSPINYFKQSIKYDIREASNSNLSASARKHYSRNAEADVKSMSKMGDKTMAYKFGAMKGDQSASKIDYANYKGTDKGYKGKTGSSHGDQSATRRDYAGKKGGSILSKHMKS
jgi:hypothetical protein